MQFSSIDVNKVFEQVNAHSKRQRGGQVAGFTLALTDDNGHDHEFLAEAFCNTYDLLVLLVHQHKLSPRGTIIVPEMIQTAN